METNQHQSRSYKKCVLVKILAFMTNLLLEHIKTVPRSMFTSLKSNLLQLSNKFKNGTLH